VDSPLELRQCALAVSVTRNIDLLPSAEGIVLEGIPPVEVSWEECSKALDGAPPLSRLGRDRLANWLRVRQTLAWLAWTEQFEGGLGSELSNRLRPLGFPADHPGHPGASWVAEHVLGGALDLGFGLTELAEPGRELDRVNEESCAHPASGSPDQLTSVQLVPVPVALLTAAGYLSAETRWWPTVGEYLDRMGEIAVQRWRRSPSGPLRPTGDCDVVTLLGSARLRAALAKSADGMRPCAVPMRTRGWTELRRVDPAFAVAAAAATSENERGFSRPLLVTHEEVTLALPGGRPAEIALRDGETESVWLARVPQR
jgi:hypothetical protein